MHKPLKVDEVIKEIKSATNVDFFKFLDNDELNSLRSVIAGYGMACVMDSTYKKDAVDFFAQEKTNDGQS